jgi:folate-dependent phosphoribosylglycinamide formyltransferase PurN
VAGERVELVVLAGYMRLLSELLRPLSGRS